MAANCGPMFFKSQITARSEVTMLEVKNSFKNNSLKLRGGGGVYIGSGLYGF